MERLFIHISDGFVLQGHVCSYTNTLFFNFLFFCIMVAFSVQKEQNGPHIFENSIFLKFAEEQEQVAY